MEILQSCTKPLIHKFQVISQLDIQKPAWEFLHIEQIEMVHAIEF